MSDHFNHEYDGGSPNIPEGVGDRYYAQDLARDFWYLVNETNIHLKDIFNSFPILLKSSDVVQGSSLHEIDIPIASGIVEYAVNVPNSFSTIPPSVKSVNILIFVKNTAQTDFDIQSTATLDGATTNYLKLSYDDADGNSRSRAKKAGSYVYEKSRSFVLTCDSSAAGDNEIVLAEIIGDDSTFLTITKRFKTAINTTVIENISSDKDFIQDDNDKILFADVTSGDITLGLFNGSNRDGSYILIMAIGATNQVFIELVSGGTTDYTLNPGDYLKVYWDDSNYEWVINDSNFLDLYYQSEESDFTPKSASKIIAETNNQSITLPDISKINTPLEIFSKGFTQILQADSENVISYKNKFFTTKGTSGYLQLRNKERAKLIYRGVDDLRIEPGVKLSDPSSLPAGVSTGCSFSFDGVYLAIAHATSPYITIYKRSGDTFTKLSDPATLPASDGYSCSFSFDGVYLAVGHSTSPYITIYKRSGDTFTKLSDPATLPTSSGRGCSFSFDGVYLAVTHLTSPYITIYERSGDTFTKLSDPSTLPTGNGKSCSFSYDGVYLAVAHETSPYITIYKRSGNTFSKLTNPATLPASTGYGCIFSYDGVYLAVGHATSPYITIYKNVELADKVWEAIKLDTLYEEDKEYMFY